MYSSAKVIKIERVFSRVMVTCTATFYETMLNKVYSLDFVEQFSFNKQM